MLLRALSKLILNVSWNRASTTSVDNLFQCFASLTIKNFSLVFSLSSSSWKPLPLVLSLQALLKHLSPSFLWAPVYPRSACEPMWCLSHSADKNKLYVCIVQEVFFLYFNLPHWRVSVMMHLLRWITAMARRLPNFFGSLSQQVERGKRVTSWNDVILPSLIQIQGSLSRLKEWVCSGSFLGWGKNGMRFQSTWVHDMHRHRLWHCQVVKCVGEQHMSSYKGISIQQNGLLLTGASWAYKK